MTSPSTPPADIRAWVDDLRLQAALLDGVDVGLCAFDLQDCALVWNRSFLRLFPEHEGHIHEGEHYGANLRRFYQGRLDASELPNIDRYIAAGIARHQAQTQPYEFEHRGGKVQVSSLPVPGRGRIRVWRPLLSAPAQSVGDAGMARRVAGELLDSVPEPLLVCDADGRFAWANAAFCEMFDVPDLQAVAGATLPALYERAWAKAGAAHDPRGVGGAAILREQLRFTGAPFELPLPHGGCCRVLARPAQDGAVFYALSDISALKRFETALQLTLDNAGRGIIRYDADGRVLLYNRQAVELLQLPEHLLVETPQLQAIVRFQSERGDPSGLDGQPGSMAAMHGIFTRGRYQRRTPAGRLLEIETTPLPEGGAVRTYTDVTESVEAQQALTEKSRALQITLDSMSQGISAIDGRGRLVFWNRRYQELLEFPDSLLTGQPTIEQLVRFQIERGDFGPDFAFVDAVARGYVAVGDRVAPLQGPGTYLRKDRMGRTLEVSTRPLPDGGVVRTFTDMTAYVRTQQELATKQAQLGALVENLPDRVWVKDTQGHFLLMNPANLRHHGLAEDAVLGRTAHEVFGPVEGERQAATDRQSLASDQPVTFEAYSFDADGTLHCAEVAKVAMRDEEGRCIGLLGIARDITARKQQEQALIQAKEEALQASKAKTRFLSSMSHEIRTPMNAILGMLTLLRDAGLNARQDDYAGKAEGAARSLLGLLNDILDFSKIEAGKMQLDLRPFSLEEMLSDLSVILSSNVGGRDIEVMYDLDPGVPDALVGDDMRLRQILINLGGNAVKFTERGEVVLRTRLVERDEACATIEFSVQDTGIGITPEQQQRLFTDYAQASEETARQFGGTGLGLGICRRLTELMESSLQLASTPGVGSCFWFAVKLPLAPLPLRQEAPRQPARVLVVDDNAHARDALAGMCQSAGWDADSAADGEEAVARVRTAAQAGRAYDAVFVDWLMPGIDGWQTCARIRELALPASSMPLVIMVTGQGREVVEQRLAREQAVLDAYLVKPVTTGMLREAYRRALSSTSAPVAAPPPPPTPRPLADLRLLLAEDNVVNQQIALELLTRRGAQVDLVDNGRAAVERLASGQRYDAVLMDVQMPVMDGLAATRELRKLPARSGLPVIAMTANAMDSDRVACLEAGMNDHVSKPFVVEEVVRTILRHVAAPQPFDDPPAARVAATPVFDRADALQRLGGDEELLGVVLQVFRGNLATAARQMQKAAAIPRDELCRVFHTVKGMAANVGAMALADAASDAEMKLRGVGGSDVDVEPLARGVAERIAEVLSAIGPPP
ncbi:MAG TPA: PAS-domain containing protein [Ramlibacter sp.]|jgi:PAS domain S-box-containing protein|nr:PAS-domain containing protein [Ramlibacter sp.]